MGGMHHGQPLACQDSAGHREHHYALPRVTAHSHPLVLACQVPSCSPTSSCWCFVASPYSSWSSPLGSLPARAALASGGSAPCSKVSIWPFLLAHASTGHPPVQPSAHGAAPLCPLPPPLAHHTGLCRHLWRLHPHTWMPCTHITACRERVPCAHARPRLHYRAHTACLASPAHVTHVPAHVMHLLCIPQPFTGIHCRHYAHIPAHATRVPSVLFLQRPLRSPEHIVGACGPSYCGHMPMVFSCTTGSGCCARVCGYWQCSKLALLWLDPAPGACPGVLPCCQLSWHMSACSLLGDLPMSCLKVDSPYTLSYMLCIVSCSD